MAQTENNPINDIVTEVMIEKLVRKMAETAITLGANAADSNGIIKALCLRNDLDPFAWYAIRLEVDGLLKQHNRIGFIA